MVSVPAAFIQIADHVIRKRHDRLLVGDVETALGARDGRLVIYPHDRDGHGVGGAIGTAAAHDDL